MERLKNLKDKVFNHLTLIKEAPNCNGRRQWIAQCSYKGPNCKGKITVDQASVVYGRKKSCGCLQSFAAGERASARKGNQHPSWRGCGEIGASYWKHLKRTASIRKIKFAATIEQAWKQFQKQNGFCALTGWKLSLGKDASLDRIDNNLGYEINNIQWVHKDLNRMKWQHSMEYFTKCCLAVSKRIRKDGTAQTNYQRHDYQF